MSLWSSPPLVTPFVGKPGQIGLSRHNLAATVPFPDLSTPLDSLYFSGCDGTLGFKIGAVSGRQIWKKRYVRLVECALFPTHSFKLRA